MKEMDRDCVKVEKGNLGFRPSRKYCNNNCGEDMKE